MALNITYFVHGTTADNEQGIASGQSAIPLAQYGILESEQLKDLTKDMAFDTVYASDLLRATQTAQIAFGDRFQIIHDERLRELDDGDFTGTPFGPRKDREMEYIDQKMPNGESYRDVQKRIEEFLKDVKSRTDGKHIAIVAHRYPQLSLEVIANGKTWQQALANDWRKTKSWQPGWDYVIT